MVHLGNKPPGTGPGYKKPSGKLGFLLWRKLLHPGGTQQRVAQLPWSATALVDVQEHAFGRPFEKAALADVRRKRKGDALFHQLILEGDSLDL